MSSDTVATLRKDLSKAHNTDHKVATICDCHTTCSTCRIIASGNEQAMVDRLHQYPCTCGHVWAWHFRTSDGVCCFHIYGRICGCKEYRPAFEQEEAKT